MDIDRPDSCVLCCGSRCFQANPSTTCAYSPLGSVCLTGTAVRPLHAAKDFIETNLHKDYLLGLNKSNLMDKHGTVWPDIKYGLGNGIS
jgi:hypothetical protein